MASAIFGDVGGCPVAPRSVNDVSVSVFREKKACQINSRHAVVFFQKQKSKKVAKRCREAADVFVFFSCLLCFFALLLCLCNDLMYVCMYVCVYVCMYVCMYVCVYVCVYVCQRKFS